MVSKLFCKALIVVGLLFTSFVGATSHSDHDDVDALRKEIQNIKDSYENRITELENKLESMEKKNAKSVVSSPSEVPATDKRAVRDNEFNPSVGIVLNSKLSQYSSDTSEVAGFAVSHEGERKRSGFAVDHTEFNFSSNVDDKFYGSSTWAIAYHEGKTELELEEAYIRTLPGFMPDGINLKLGRAFWTLGYLNEHHSHADDFSDRPLPYRVLLNNAFNDDGLELSYVLPTDLYTEIGAGLFRGDDFPFGGADGKSQGGWSAFARVGSDIGQNQSWRMGLYQLTGEAVGGRESNEENVKFIGDTDLQVVDLRYTWAPTGNATDRELILQAETFWRQEKGTYEDTEAATGAVNFNGSKEKVGIYAQIVYKFSPQWRVGMRYSELEAPVVPAGLVGSALDAGGHKPQNQSVMLDWTNSEFSRVRLQFNQEELALGKNDSQFMLQFIMSLGAHAAHKY